jgi:DNA polymerase-3 subunit delta
MDHKAIIKNIKEKNFEKIYFLHGEEPFYIDTITNAIVENALEEHEKDFNQSIVYGKDSDVHAIIADAKGYPMMAERRLVVIKEAQDLKGIEDLESYFNKPSDQTVFVVNYKYKKFDSRKKVFKAASKNGLAFQSAKIPEYKLLDWINMFAKEMGYGINPKAAMLLMEFLGNNLSKISNELEKLEILVEKGTAINEVHIEENIGISKDYNAFELVNAIGIRDVSKANRIVDYFNHNPKATPLIVVISNIFNHFQKLMKIHFAENKSREGLASILRVPPFVAGELQKSAKIYNPKKIAANIAILHEYDLKVKGVGNASATDGELLKEMIYRLMH